MALPITTKTDYKGKIRISTAKGTQLDEYITEYERKYLKMLLNVECYNDIKDTDPLPQKYLDLINGVQYTNDNGDLVDFEGLKKILLRFIYAEYVSDNFQTSIGGNVSSINENSTVLKGGNTVIIAQRYNEAIDRLCGLYEFLDDKEEFNQYIVTSTQVLGVYTLGVSSTEYLSNGDTITLKGDITGTPFEKDYVVSNVVENISFDINEAGGYAFGSTNIFANYNPFFDVCPIKPKYISII